VIVGLEDIDVIVEKIKYKLPSGGIVILNGNLGSGKTTLVKAFAKDAGVANLVSSPTFSLQNIYDDTIFHYDIYNITLAKFLSLGLLEELTKEGYHFIEWGGENLYHLLADIGLMAIQINIENIEDKREYTFCIH
jgi:tRNA threonylcarbamoyladenosine biosynthesis protein TsaE